MSKTSTTRAVRPAFVATTVITLASCTPERHVNPPPPPNPPAASAAPVAEQAPPKKNGVHPRDEAGHLVFRRANGTCYVQVDKAGPPPKDLMSGERWVEDKDVACPKEFSDPAFAAIPDGKYWVQDEKGECAQAASFGNPPPPPVATPCPPILQKKP
jgi:hypothetical protein